MKELSLPLSKSEILLLYKILLAQDEEKHTRPQFKKIDAITEKVEKVIYDSEVHYPKRHGVVAPPPRVK